MNAIESAVEHDDDRHRFARFDVGTLALFQPNNMLPEGPEAAAISTPCRIAGITFSDEAVRYDIDVLVTEPSGVLSSRLYHVPSLMIRPTIELAGKVEGGGAELSEVAALMQAAKGVKPEHYAPYQPLAGAAE